LDTLQPSQYTDDAFFGYLVIKNTLQKSSAGYSGFRLLRTGHPVKNPFAKYRYKTKSPETESHLRAIWPGKSDTSVIGLLYMRKKHPPHPSSSSIQTILSAPESHRINLSARGLYRR